uniref:Uncharacterized protein n=1 Tax=Steinernema glaseri TaxID=37863 RepID=A0A1I8AHS2_9BILA
MESDPDRRFTADYSPFQAVLIIGSLFSVCLRDVAPRRLDKASARVGDNPESVAENPLGSIDRIGPLSAPSGCEIGGMENIPLLVAKPVNCPSLPLDPQ